MPKTAKKTLDTAELQVIELTQAGFDELKLELNELLDKKLPETIARVATAREHGDLSENAEYHSARDEQQLLEARIDEIQHVFSIAKVVKIHQNVGVVSLGSQITIKNFKTNTNKTVSLVGEFEAKPAENKISSASPLGKALVGKKKGDKISVVAPAGEIEYSIEAIK
ncbi:MAG: transcription elongation factor GreA [Candidatus Pacebacteria bacterium CG_4_10_14_0_8_um_filter_42_14]|nr:MAG: transcription elongation factor GreA [Candidatus Pacebacteria bacterium CG_4_10_14_0_8_um_filter_42_14]